MAWTFVNAGGAAIRGGAGATNPPAAFQVGLPAGVATGDLILLQLQVSGGSANPPVPISPTGYTQIALITNGGAGNSRHWYGYRRYVAGDLNPSFTFTGAGTTTVNNGDTYTARAFAYRPGAGYDWLIDVTGTASTNASSTNIGPATGITPTTLNSPLQTLIVGSFGKSNDFNVATSPANFVGTTTSSTTGIDGSCHHIHRLNPPQPVAATGNLTVTDSGNNPGLGASILVSFKEDPLTVSGIALRNFAVIC